MPVEIRTPNLNRDLAVILGGSWVIAGLVGAALGYGIMRVWRAVR